MIINVQLPLELMNSSANYHKNIRRGNNSNQKISSRLNISRVLVWKRQSFVEKEKVPIPHLKISHLCPNLRLCSGCRCCPCCRCRCCCSFRTNPFALPSKRNPARNGQEASQENHWRKRAWLSCQIMGMSEAHPNPTPPPMKGGPQ